MSFPRRQFIASIPVLLSGLSAAEKPLVRVGCQANGWPLQEGNFDQLLSVLREMRKFGYTGFECNIRFVKGQFPRAAEARKAIEATGVRFVGAHTSMEQASTDDFAANAAGVASLGVDRIVMSAKALSPEGRFSTAALQSKADQLNALAKTAREKGTRIAYHNHNDEFVNGNAEIEALAEATNPDLLDFLVDAGHAYLGGGDPARFLSSHAKRVFGFHLKTYKGKDNQVPLGQGDFGFESLAAAIKNAQWSGWLITEEGGGPKPGNTAAVQPDRAYIRRTFGV